MVSNNTRHAAVWVPPVLKLVRSVGAWQRVRPRCTSTSAAHICAGLCDVGCVSTVPPHGCCKLGNAPSTRTCANTAVRRRPPRSVPIVSLQATKAS